MKFKLKDPGSAITHGIALLLAVTGAIPLIIKAARSYDVIHIVALSVFILTMILLYAAQYYLSLHRFYRKSKPASPQSRSYDDFHYDCRQLHSGMSHCSS